MKRAIAKIKAMKTIRLRVPSSTNENLNLNEMKTKNNVQKAILRSAAVVVSLVLISYTVSAQDFWKRLLENSSFSEIAMVMTETKKETKAETEHSTSINAVFLETDVEEELEVEAWMTNESNFGLAGLQFVEDAETELELEDWMLDSELFQPEFETEPSLTVENWMISDKVWRI